jgi:hypothetical protein
LTSRQRRPSAWAEDLLALGVDPALVDIGGRAHDAVLHDPGDGDADRRVLGQVVGELVGDLVDDRGDRGGWTPPAWRS